MSAAPSPRLLRWIGGACLALAIAMLLAGELSLKKHLPGVILLAYWAVCLLLTGLAMIIAFLDLRRVRRKGREVQLEILQDTLKTIEEERKKREK